MNTLGNYLRVSSFGESHGPAVGCVIEGVPAGILIDAEQVQTEVNRRKTAQTNFSSTREEDDVVEYVSGIKDGYTLGYPITLTIKNKNQKPGDYNSLQKVYRPSHADYTYHSKYGIRDHRGGGRSSARITAPMVAAGAIANQVIQKFYNVQVFAYVSQIGQVQLPSDAKIELTEIYSSELRCPHQETTRRMLQEMEKAKEEQDTLGGIITAIVLNLPPGIGEPVFGKLNAELGHAMFNINTVKGVEFGDGFGICGKRGSEVNDLFTFDGDKIITQTNHSAGIQGGISNGMPIHFNIAFKPISSIGKKQQTVTSEGQKTEIEIKGRHDTCAVPRAVPIVVAYTNIILADLILLSRLNKLT